VNSESSYVRSTAAARPYVITAAHCLPRIPVDHFDEVETTIRSWDSNDETKLVVIYCDPISDVAVLKNETHCGGGNVAENAGGVHCLKYGLTVHNVLSVTFLTLGRRALRDRRSDPRRPRL
jgi:FAD/FMN-containing dehydrogenase